MTVCLLYIILLVLVKEEAEENSKTVSTIPTNIIEENEAELLKKEKELTKELNDLREKHKLILLSYQNVCNNIRNLCEYHKENCGEYISSAEEIKEEDKKEEDTKEEVKEEEKKEEPKPEEEKKEENNEEEKMEEVKEEEPKPEEAKVEDVIKEGEAVVEKKEGDENQQTTLANNLNTNAETEEPIIIKETPEETSLINDYNNFLQQALKTFDILFLCHSKHDFLNLMREKGIEMQQQAANKGITQNKKRRTTNRRMTNNSRVVKTESNVQGIEEEDNDEKYNPDKDILLRFVREMKKSRDEFVIPEKDKPKIIIKKPINN